MLPYTQALFERLCKSAILAFPAVALAGCAMLFGPTSNPRSSETMEVSTIEGCKLQRIYYQYRDADSDYTRSSNSDDRKQVSDSRYSWSGRCEDGYVSGPGELSVQTVYGVSKEFFVAKPGKPRKYFTWLFKDDAGKIQIIGGYRRQFTGTFGPHDTIESTVSDAECADTGECRVLRDALSSVLDADQITKVAADSTRWADVEKIRVQNAIQRDEIAKKEAEAEMRQIEQANRAQKDRWLAAQARNDNSSGTLSALGTIAQVAGAAGGKNSAPLQAIGAAVQGGTGFDQGRGVGSVGGNSPDLGSNVQYAQPVRCVGVAPAKTSSRDVYLVNTCSFPVYARYCINSQKRGGELSSNNCGEHRTNEIYLKPNDPQYVMAGGSVDAHAINSVSCKVPYVVPVDLITWNGAQFSGQCVHSTKFGTDPNRGY